MILDVERLDLFYGDAQALDQVTLDGVRFLGCTLWSDFEFDGPERRREAMALCERVVNDYRVLPCLLFARRDRIHPTTRTTPPTMITG